MDITIAIHGDPTSSESPRSALRFARAAVANGHRIHRVFFYHSSVVIANALAVPPQGEPDTAKDWAEFARAHDVELAVCIAAALRRGVLTPEDAQRYERGTSNVMPPYQIVGLGQLVEAAAASDRFVTFTA